MEPQRLGVFERLGVERARLEREPLVDHQRVAGERRVELGERLIALRARRARTASSARPAGRSCCRRRRTAPWRGAGLGGVGGGEIDQRLRLELARAACLGVEAVGHRAAAIVQRVPLGRQDACRCKALSASRVGVDRARIVHHQLFGRDRSRPAGSAARRASGRRASCRPARRRRHRRSRRGPCRWRRRQPIRSPRRPDAGPPAAASPRSARTDRRRGGRGTAGLRPSGWRSIATGAEKPRLIDSTGGWANPAKVKLCSASSSTSSCSPRLRAAGPVEQRGAQRDRHRLLVGLARGRRHGLAQGAA